jgi:hypothetical protein
MKKIILSLIVILSCLGKMNAQVDFVYIDLSYKVNREKVYQWMENTLSEASREKRIIFISNNLKPISNKSSHSLAGIEGTFFSMLPSKPELFFELDTLCNILNSEPIKSINYIAGNQINGEDHFLNFLSAIDLVFLIPTREKIPVSILGSNPKFEAQLNEINPKLKNKFSIHVKEF